MTDRGPPAELIDELTRLPQGDELAKLTRAVAERAVAARRRDLAEVGAALVRAAPVPREGNQTSEGDPIAALERGPRDAGERYLLGALLARGVALAPPSGVEAEDKAAAELLWLAGHVGLDAFVTLDAALGERSGGLWGALGDVIRRIDAGRESLLDRADALVGAVALRASTHPEAQATCARLVDELTDDRLRSLLRGQGDDQDGPVLQGEIEPAPRGVIATALLAVTGLLLVGRAARLVGRLALGRRKPAELVVGTDGFRVRSRTEMLGKVTGQSEQVLPSTGLIRATREVRFARLSLYVGLLALFAGSYVGVSLFVDGARAASPTLLGQGLLVAGLGVAVELALTTLAPARAGRCRVVLVPRKGDAVCIGGLDVDAAQRALARVVRRG